MPLTDPPLNVILLYSLRIANTENVSIKFRLPLNIMTFLICSFDVNHVNYLNYIILCVFFTLSAALIDDNDRFKHRGTLLTIKKIVLRLKHFVYSNSNILTCQCASQQFLLKVYCYFFFCSAALKIFVLIKLDPYYSNNCRDNFSDALSRCRVIRTYCSLILGCSI